MLETVFKGIFDTTGQSVISIGDFLLCIGVSLLIGLFLAFSYSFKSITTKSFAVTLALIPAVVCAVIMMVNGNIGAGVAVAGAFSLVRFRSAPGTAKEICAIFLAMGTGLITGMGYLGYGAVFAVILGLLYMLYNALNLGKTKASNLYKTLRITIPEDLDYTEVFDELMKEYTDYYEVVQVKTTNMGSLFKLTYDIKFKAGSNEKEFIDALRCRNGNLEISISRHENTSMTL